MFNSPLHRNTVVYDDGYYTLGTADGRPCLTAGEKRYLLSCHPYEPCLYITDGTGGLTSVHNAFDPAVVLEAFAAGRAVRSVTGREYDAPDFCRMVEAAAGRGDLGIDAAERLFADRTKQQAPATKNAPAKAARGRFDPAPAETPDDPVYALLARYPRLVVEYCIVKLAGPYLGLPSHRSALAAACGQLFVQDEPGFPPWRSDPKSAVGRPVPTAAFFADAGAEAPLCYRRAFLDPPHGSGCTAADFDRVNRALFPAGTGALEVMEWSTDWSEYFDDGHEWWGALCATVYDRSLDRFVAILASATD